MAVKEFVGARRNSWTWGKIFEAKQILLLPGSSEESMISKWGQELLQTRGQATLTEYLDLCILIAVIPITCGAVFMSVLWGMKHFYKDTWESSRTVGIKREIYVGAKFEILTQLFCHNTQFL